MLIKETKYCYEDIAVVPAIKSCVKHREECNPFTMVIDNNPLPIFASPMSTVVNERNFPMFIKNKIIPILPRNISYRIRLNHLNNGDWVALSLQEFKESFVERKWCYFKDFDVNVLIDTANGHMEELHRAIYDAKINYKKYSANRTKHFRIMCGNIANPQTYYELARAGADFVRCSVGTGCGCITSSNTSIHYPIASLISEIYEIKKKIEQGGDVAPYIIADGGVRGYADVIKSLALGADFVMIGSEFAKLTESAAPTYYYQNDGESITFLHSNADIKFLGDAFEIDGEYVVDNLYKTFYGMASRQGQEDMNGKKTRTSEGTVKDFKCTLNLEKWSDNMVSYLRSAMSYTNSFNISEFNPQKVDCIVVSPLTKQSINK